MGATRSGTYLRLVGRFLGTGCDDEPDEQSGGLFACASPGEVDEEVKPMTDMAVTVLGPLPRKVWADDRRMKFLNRGIVDYDVSWDHFVWGVSEKVGEVDADENYEIDERIELPELGRGRYLLQVGDMLTLFQVVK